MSSQKPKRICVRWIKRAEWKEPGWTKPGWTKHPARAAGFAILWAAVAGVCGLAALAQYPGKIAKSGKADPVLRSVAVLEWTGEAGKPSASRLVPVTVFDGEHLNDGTIYLNRPEPLALGTGVEYELQTNGKPMGVFDLFGAGEVEGAWRGFGAWKPLSASAQVKAEAAVNTSSLYAPVKVEDDDHPVLKRKHPKGADSDGDADAAGAAGKAGKAPDSGTAAGGTGTETGPAAPQDVDPDRPTLKRKSADASATPDSGKESAGKGDVDPDRPTIRRSHKSASTDPDMLETALSTPDPDRPRLKRGKPADSGAQEAPKLEGLPPQMQQAVAVSDARTKAEHPWKYTWANPADELKMKLALENIARAALGLSAPVPSPVPVKGAKRAVVPRRPNKPPISTAAVVLADEQFRVFELAYGASATLILTASTPEAPLAQPVEDKAVSHAEPAPPVIKTAPQKFVTLIAQPDLYGGLLVLYKSVTDKGHLDQTPRMKLVDAVDAMGDNRGELLFELRNSGQRQFALYRVLRGSAEQLFATVQIP